MVNEIGQWLFLLICKNTDLNPDPFHMLSVTLMDTGPIPDPILRWRGDPESKIGCATFFNLF